jgi:hypothetical protein
MPDVVPAAKANWRTTVLGILGALPLVINGIAWIIQNGQRARDSEHSFGPRNCRGRVGRL